MTHADAVREMTEGCLCFRVRRASRALTRLYDEALRPLEIQATQLTVLNAVAMGERHGAREGAEARGTPIGRLADVLAMDATTLSRNLDPLKEAGFVRVERSAADGRVRLVRLTEEGGRMLEKALPCWRKAHRRVVSALGREAAELRDHLDAAVAAAAELPSEGEYAS